jgi:hypothetical protein
MASRKDHYRNMFSQDDSPGLEAITRKQKDLYKEQEPTHWPTIVPYDIGGEDPLWAVNCFESERQQKHYHYITLGFTNLFYDENFAEDRVNGYGFELTFRHKPVAGDPESPVWPVNMLQNVARYVFKTHKTFEHFQFMSANGPLRLETQTDITAVVFHTDPEMGEIETPHGRVKFLQLYGITTQEYRALQSGKDQVHDLIERHLASNPLLITDLSRTDQKK